MHLHDALRLWRAEIVGASPHVAIDLHDLPDHASLLEGLTREALPRRLRRDDDSAIQAVLVPALHTPGPPATGEALDALEARLGFELPRGVELLLSLHDGGEFFAPTLEGLPTPLDAPLRLLSCDEMVEAYGELLTRMQAALDDADPDEDDLFRLARRFGAPKEEAPILAAQLGRVFGGADRGLEVLPLSRVAGSPDLICYVPRSGKLGRVGHAYGVSGYLPEHSDEYPFEGLEGWLEAIVRSHGCRRVVSV